MGLFFAKALQAAARTTNAAVQGVAVRSAQQPAARGGKGKPSCTPCEAMARREAAARAVRGVVGR